MKNEKFVKIETKKLNSNDTLKIFEPKKYSTNYIFPTLLLGRFAGNLAAFLCSALLGALAAFAGGAACDTTFGGHDLIGSFATGAECLSCRII